MSGRLFPGPPPAGPGPGADAPLAERLRPRDLDAMVGQDHLLGEGRLLRRLVDEGRFPSMVLWGPPGTGKTTLARLLARTADMDFSPLSAVTGGVKDLKAAVAEARAARRDGRRTLLFVDEIHRFNKAQQDALLPHVEDGTVVFVGATTENPSFEVNAALLSRCRVVELHALDEDALGVLLDRALGDADRGLGERGAVVEDEARAMLLRAADGDGRRLLNALEASVDGAAGDDGPPRVTAAVVADAVERTLRYDRAGDQHYDLVSALHKSLRDSDADASLYWLARMLEGGEDPIYVARRLVRMASEDVGLADPGALEQAMAAQQAVHLVGLPEGALALAQAVVHLALAPKSDALYRAWNAAAAAAREGGSLPVPMHLRNAPTRLMRELGRGAGYRHAHDQPEGVSGLENLPPELAGRRFYEPRERGFERDLRKRRDWYAKQRAAARARRAAETPSEPEEGDA